MNYEISENHLSSFTSLAHVIERKLLEMQMALIAHRHPIRFVHVRYEPFFSEDELNKIDNAINALYDLLEKFCNGFDLPVEHVSLRNELMVKANFLWEDLNGATVKSLRGHGEINEEVKIIYEQKINQMINATNHLINQFN
jgi:hypothetical protein